MTMKEALYQIRDTLEGVTLPIRETQAITEISAAAGLARACIRTVEAAEEQQEAQQAEAAAADPEEALLDDLGKVEG
jgi:hypothetical protein